jgi:hypothetical protein
MNKFSVLVLLVIWASLSAFTPRTGRHIAEGGSRAVTLGGSYDVAISKHSPDARVGHTSEAYKHIAMDLNLEAGRILGPLDVGLNLSSLWYMSTIDLYLSFLSTGTLALGAGAELGFIQAPYLLGTIEFAGFFISLKPRFVIYAAGSNWDNGFDESGLYALNGVLSFGTLNLFKHIELSIVASVSRALGSGFEWFNYSDAFGKDFYDVPRIPIKNYGTVGAMAGFRF